MFHIASPTVSKTGKPKCWVPPRPKVRCPQAMQASPAQRPLQACVPPQPAQRTQVMHYLEKPAPWNFPSFFWAARTINVPRGTLMAPRGTMRSWS